MQTEGCAPGTSRRSTGSPTGPAPVICERSLDTLVGNRHTCLGVMGEPGAFFCRVRCPHPGEEPSGDGVGEGDTDGTSQIHCQRFGAAGVLLVVAGGALFATAVSASAAAATITLTPGPTTGYGDGQLITITGSGFSPNAQVYSVRVQPSVGPTDDSRFRPEPPGRCTPPIGAGKATSTGTFKKPLPAAVVSGVTGPPATGTDNAREPPLELTRRPTPARSTPIESGGCAFYAYDSKGVAATPVPFTFASSVPTRRRDDHDTGRRHLHEDVGNGHIGWSDRYIEPGHLCEHGNGRQRVG